MRDSVRCALVALVLAAAAPAHAGREDDLREQVMTRARGLNDAVARCQRRIAADEIDVCSVNVDWENRSVGMSEATSIANRMLSSLRTHSIVVKSFIQRIDTSSLTGDTKTRAENLYAKFSNLGFSEQPATPARNAGDFRLWSEARVTATCRGDRLDQWQFGGLGSEFGREFGILGAYGEVMAPLRASPSLGGSNADRVDFSYAIRGRPNSAALPTFRLVHHRACVWIWHKVEGSLRCRGGTPELSFRTTGSRFPSHRTWVDGRQRPTIDQGPFATLWECDPQNSEMVR